MFPMATSFFEPAWEGREGGRERGNEGGREGGGALKIPLLPWGMIEGVKGGVDREIVSLSSKTPLPILL